MNYITEINAFYDTIERKPLSASAVTLWHALMHINNKANWADTFTVAAIVLQFKTGLSASSFKRARTELSDKGYITHEPRSRNQSPIYQMMRLSSHTKKETDPPSQHSKETAPNHQIDQDSDQDKNHIKDQSLGHLTDHQPDPLIKQDQTKPNQTKQNNNNQPEPTDAIIFHQQNFGIASPFVSESILKWTNDLPEELVIHAMERALEQGKAHWGYAKGILKAWHKKGIQTVNDAKADATRYRNQKQSTKSHTSQEVIPDWFTEQAQEPKPPTKVKTYTPQEEKTILEETQAMIESFI